ARFALRIGQALAKLLIDLAAVAGRRRGCRGGTRFYGGRRFAAHAGRDQGQPQSRYGYPVPPAGHATNPSFQRRSSAKASTRSAGARPRRSRSVRNTPEVSVRRNGLAAFSSPSVVGSVGRPSPR